MKENITCERRRCQACQPYQAIYSQTDPLEVDVIRVRTRLLLRLGPGSPNRARLFTQQVAPSHPSAPIG